jgi:hypothetical protein
MRKRHLIFTPMTCILVTAISMSCNSPAEPSQEPTPGGFSVAWFNSLGYTVDLYFPESDSLVTGAFVTDEIPNDIISFENDRIAILNSFSSTVQVFDIDSTGGELFHIDLPSGSNPYLMSWDDENLWVTLLMTSQVAKVDLIPGGSVTTYDVKANPTSIASDGTSVLVGHGTWPDTSVSGGITVLDASTGSVVDSIITNDNVTYIRYFNDTGMVHAVTSTYNDGSIAIIDPASRQILATVNTGGSPVYPVQAGSGFISADGWMSGNIYFYDESGTLGDTWATGLSSAWGVACSGDTAYITDFNTDIVLVADWNTKTLLDTLEAGSSGPQGIVTVER